MRNVSASICAEVFIWVGVNLTSVGQKSAHSIRRGSGLDTTEQSWSLEIVLQILPAVSYSLATRARAFEQRMTRRADNTLYSSASSCVI